MLVLVVGKTNLHVVVDVKQIVVMTNQLAAVLHQPVVVQRLVVNRHHLHVQCVQQQVAQIWI